MERKIVAFDLDDEEHWRAELDCGHYQHLRHDPPLRNRPWVLTEEGRAERLGGILECKKCDSAYALGVQDESSVGEIMEADHVELDRLLAALIDEIGNERPDLIAAYRKLDLFWARLAVHIRAEHLAVFPSAIETAVGLGKDHEEIAAPLQELRRDHDFFIKELARAVKAMRLVPEFGNEEETFVIVRNLVDGVRQRLERHNQIEEEIIYPLASERIHARVKMELENLPQRFSGPQPESLNKTKKPR